MNEDDTDFLSICGDQCKSVSHAIFSLFFYQSRKNVTFSLPLRLMIKALSVLSVTYSRRVLGAERRS
jgi:hypothetical protein